MNYELMMKLEEFLINIFLNSLKEFIPQFIIHHSSFIIY